MSTPKKLAEIIEEFQAAPREFKLPMLLEYSRKVPPLPEKYANNPDLLEQVHECQTPFFLAEEIDDDGRVEIHFDAPQEAPTTRSFAGIIYEGLNGLTAEEILAVPDHFYTQMGLSDVVTPLRQRGMAGILWRLKKRVSAEMDARAAS